MIHPYTSFNLYDNDYFDYGIVQEGPFRYRGPRLSSSNYWVCIGTAMTFGRYVDRPFPAILNDNVPSINFGFGHLDPKQILSSRWHMNIVCTASLLIVQFSPLPHYLDGLNKLLKASQKSLILVFGDVQPTCHLPFGNAIVVPGDAVNEFYPSQETHERAAEMILRQQNVLPPLTL